MSESKHSKQNMNSAYSPYLYEITHCGNVGDLSFYMHVCTHKKKILEIGSGTGRLLLPIAQEGYSITGLEYSPQMIEYTRQKIDAEPALSNADIKLIQGDMRDFTGIEETYDCILLPFNVLYCLLSQEDMIQCLTHVRTHLRPGGSCVFDIHIVDEYDLERIDPEEWEVFASLEHEERIITISERRTWKRDEQRVDAYYRYYIQENETTRIEEYCIPQTYITPEQCESILERSGLFPTQIFGDFTGGPLTDESEHLIVWAKSF